MDGINVTGVSLRLAPFEVSGSVASSEYVVELLPDLVVYADWEPKDWSSRTLVDLGDIVMDPEEEDKRASSPEEEISWALPLISLLARIRERATSVEQAFHRSGGEYRVRLWERLHLQGEECREA